MMRQFTMWLADKLTPYEYEKTVYRYCVSKGYSTLLDLDMLKDGQWVRVLSAEPKREILKYTKRGGGYTYVTKRERIA